MDPFAPLKLQVIWHLPDSDRRYVGELAYDPESGTDLTTKLNFDWEDAQQFEGGARLPVIFATDAGGRQWTVLGAFVQLLGTSSIHLSGASLLASGFYREGLQTQFESCQFRLPFLDDWLGRRPFSETTRDFSADEKSWKYMRPASINLELPESNLSLTLGGGLESAYGRTSLTLEYKSEFSLRVLDGAAQTGEWYRARAHYLATFFATILGQPMPLLNLTFCNNDGDPVQFVARQSYRQPAQDYVHSQSVLVKYDEVANDLALILDNWIASTAETLDMVVGLLHSYRTDSTGNLPARFLMLCTAFEVFHRRTGAGLYDDYTLRKRFKKVFESLPPPLLEFFPAKDHFIHTVVEWRNQLTHYPEQGKNGDFKAADEVHPLCQRLELLIVVLLLNHVGISLEILAGGAARCWRYRNLAGARALSSEVVKLRRDGKDLLIEHVFWDHPDLKTEAGLRERLAAANLAERDWMLARMLDYGRVVDTMRLFELAEIRSRINFLPLRPETRDAVCQKWMRLLEVYAVPGK